MKQIITTLLALAILPLAALGQTSAEGLPLKIVTNADIVGLTHWSADTVWLMDGKVYVEPGEVLVIDPGTIVKGEDLTGEQATALVVMRGGRLYAEGTPQSPIIFTSKYDNVNDPGDLPLDDPAQSRGLWGGVIVLGYARVNNTTGEGQIEGIPITEAQGLYGGGLTPNDDDNSGVIKYVSIRHGGISIAANNEINGLTMGAVGRGTVISHVEVFSNLDDGFEWFGGTVNTDHLTAAFCGDDSFDWDQGFAGSGQFWFTIGAEDSDRSGEHDGGTSPKDGVPFTTTCVSNATYIGAGPTGNQFGFWIEDNGGGAYLNSIFTDEALYGIGVDNNLGDGHTSLQNLQGGQLLFKNNFWWDCGPTNTASAICNADAAVQAMIFDNGNDDIMDPSLGGISRANDGGLDPRPTADFAGAGWIWIDPLGVDGYNPTDPVGYPGAIDAVYKPFVAVDYPGAFAPGERPWICGWTALSFYGYIGMDCSYAPFECITDNGKTTNMVTTADVDGFTVWDRDHVWQMSGKIYVEPTDTLLIEPGTIVKGEDQTGEQATALVVMRDGLGYFLGAPDCPVIFTSIYDDVDDPGDVPLDDPAQSRGLWGGVVVLGNARVNNTTGEGQIEGIPITEAQGLYGGGLTPDDDDNSGVYRFVSVRHGGVAIAANNEINGFTMGAVGRGTVISHVEVFANLDDGFEWFGGTVNTDHLSVAMCGDDSFDWDQGFAGSGQFWFTIGAEDSDRNGEHDGGTSPKDGVPFTTTCVSNATYIGAGPTGNQFGFWIEDNGGGAYLNSIFTDEALYGIGVDNNLGDGHTSLQNLQDGQLLFKNNFWWDCGPTNTASAICNADAAVQAMIFDNGNDNIMDPGLRAISRLTTSSLDPRPCADFAGAGWSWIDPLGVDGYNPTDPVGYPGAIDAVYRPYVAVDYPGAFDPNIDIESSWAGNWTALHFYGYLAPVACASGSCCVGMRGDANGSGAEMPTIGDISAMIDAKFIAQTCDGIIPCPTEADVNGSGVGESTCADVTIGDISLITDFLFITGPANWDPPNTLRPCQ
jgi:hypothetical protein